MSKIPLTKSTFFQEQITKAELAEFILGADRLSMGNYCREFELKFSNYQDRQHSVFVSSGSAANLALIQSLLNLGRLQKGCKVGVSALTWATNVMPLIQLGLEPVVIDVEVETLNISPDKLASFLKNIDCLFITNALGLCDNLVAIKQMCDERHIILLEDNCESLGSTSNGVKLGNFGLASTFSFFVGHHLSTIEGGMICTDDQDLADMLIMVRAHGWDRNLSPSKRNELREVNYVSENKALYTFYDLSFNLRPTEINGFLGCNQIKYLDEIVRKRQNNYEKIKYILNSSNDIIQINDDYMDTVSSFSFPVVYKSKEMALRLLRRLTDEGVETRPIIAGNIVVQPFANKYGLTGDCPNAEFVDKNGFYLPNNPDITDSEISIFGNILCG